MQHSLAQSRQWQNPLPLPTVKVEQATGGHLNNAEDTGQKDEPETMCALVAAIQRYLRTMTLSLVTSFLSFLITANMCSD